MQQALEGSTTPCQSMSHQSKHMVLLKTMRTRRAMSSLKHQIRPVLATTHGKRANPGRTTWLKIPTQLLSNQIPTAHLSTQHKQVMGSAQPFLEQQPAQIPLLFSTH